MHSADTFTQFAAAINHHDPSALTALVTPEHVFIDALGTRVNHVLADGGLILAAGEAGGTIDGVSWRIPGAWKAVIRDGHIAEFRVFADNQPVYEILARRGK